MLVPLVPEAGPVAPKRKTSQFGRLLRNLRKRRNLTLKQVAAASRDTAFDSAGSISHPYLSQLESGAVSTPSLAKIVTLARLYQVDHRELIAKAPAADRRRLFEELAAWRRAGREIPSPLDHYLPPEDRERICARIDGLLAPLASSVSIPLDRDLECRDMARWFLLYAAAPAYLDRAGRDIPRLFWAAHAACAQRVAAREDATRDRAWRDLLLHFGGWLMYETGHIDQVLSTVSSWTLDFSTTLGRCHFTDGPSEERYGFDDVPLALVHAVRQHEFAHRLAGATPPTLSPLPSPPPLVEALRHYFEDLLYPQWARYPEAPRPTMPAVLKQLTVLAQALPELENAPDPDPIVHAAVVRFLRRSIASGTPPPPARSPPQSARRS